MRGGGFLGKQYCLFPLCKPFIPSIVLTTQIATLSLRLAKSVNRPAPFSQSLRRFLDGEGEDGQG